MNNRTEWVTDANVEMKVIDFGPIGENLDIAWQNDLRELLAGIDMPEVLLNSGQLNEGIAKVQLEGWQRGITNYQDMIESIIIEKIINPYLLAQGLKTNDIDFIWNVPGESEINARLEKLTATLGTFALSPNLRRMLELEVARLLNIQDSEKYLPKPEEGLNEEREAELAMPQPKVPGAKPNFKPKTQEMHEQHEWDFGAMDIRSFLEIREANGLTYSDYLVAVLKQLKVDKFDDLRAITEKDIENGLLTEEQITKLKTILREGFRRNQTIKSVEQNIKETLNLKDRIKEDGTTLPKESRPEMIARTEIVRLSNEGLKTLYEDNNIKNVVWVASMSERTCPDCMQMDGQVYPIKEAYGDKIPPLHVNCRCSLLPA